MVNFFHVFHERVFPVEQIVVYLHHMIDVGASFHLYMASLAIDERVAFGGIRHQLYQFLGRTASDVVHPHAVCGVFRGRDVFCCLSSVANGCFLG